MGKLGFSIQIMSVTIATLVAVISYGQNPTLATTAPHRPGTSRVAPNPQEMTPSVANRREVISKLKNLQARQSQLLGEIDTKMKGKLKETQNIKISDDAVTSELRMNRLQETIESLEQKRREAIERSQFIDRLIFAVDTKWTKDTIKVFLEQTLLDIASAEMNQTDAKAAAHIWKFSTYLSVAVRELAEPREDLISFIANYMDFSSILAPKPPTAFSQARSYTNGVQSEPAKVTSVEDLGDGVEKRVKNINTDEPAVIQGTTSAPIEVIKPIEPAQPSTIPPSAPNPQPTAIQNSN